MYSEKIGSLTTFQKLGILNLAPKDDDFDIEAYIPQVDFEKAFDSIEWPFLFQPYKNLVLENVLEIG